MVGWSVHSQPSTGVGEGGAEKDSQSSHGGAGHEPDGLDLGHHWVTYASSASGVPPLSAMTTTGNPQP
jgi:hypothetical protein